MKRRFAIALLICAIALLLSALVGSFFSGRKPSFQGKDVYQWMLEQNSSALEDNPGLTAIGSNAVPFIARTLGIDKTMYDRFAWVRKASFQRFAKRRNLSFTWRTSAEIVRSCATSSLLAFGFESKPALPQLHAALVRTRDAEQQRILYCVHVIGPAPESIPWLVKGFRLLTNDAYGVRRDFIHALGSGGSNAARMAMPLVIGSLSDTNWDVRSAAALGLARWAQPAPQAIKPLLSLLNSTNEDAAMSAAMALGKITNRCDEAEAGLQRLAGSPNDFTRAVAAITRWRLGGDAEQTRRTLEGLLVGRKRGAAADYLGELGAAAKPSVPALLDAAQATAGARVEMHQRARCAIAVLRIQGESAEACRFLDETITTLNDYWSRAIVASEIGKLGAPARPLIPALRKALKDHNRQVRHEAALALERLKREGVDAP